MTLAAFMFASLENLRIVADRGCALLTAGRAFLGKFSLTLHRIAAGRDRVG